MTRRQEQLIDRMTENEIRVQISSIMQSMMKNDEKQELLAYCEKKLDGLNVENAMIETSDPDDMEGLNR